MNDDRKDIFKIIEDNHKWHVRKTRLFFVIIIILFTIAMNLAAYVMLGDDYFTHYLGK